MDLEPSFHADLDGDDEGFDVSSRVWTILPLHILSGSSDNSLKGLSCQWQMPSHVVITLKSTKHELFRPYLSGSRQFCLRGILKYRDVIHHALKHSVSYHSAAKYS